MVDPHDPISIHHADDATPEVDHQTHNAQEEESIDANSLPHIPSGNDETIEIPSQSDPEIKVDPDGGATQLNPARKRKLAETSLKSSPARAASPPWKKFIADGPTSFVVDGKRKSSRTNTLPLQLQLGADQKRHTRAALNKAQQTPPKAKGTPGRNGVSSSPSRPAPQARGLTSSPRSKGLQSAKSSMPPPPKPSKTPATNTEITQPKRRGRPPNSARQHIQKATNETSPPKRGRRSSRVSAGSSDLKNDVHEQTQPAPGRLKIKIRMLARPLEIRHPGSIPKPKAFDSFESWIAQEDPLEGDDGPIMTEKDAAKNAKHALRILDAAQPGGLLSEERCSVYQQEPMKEIPPQYGHWDFVVAHTINFGGLLKKEQRDHRALARKLAHEAKAFVQGKDKTISQEQLEKDEAKRILERHKQVVRDMKTLWKLVGVEVHKLRVGRWEEKQHELGKQALDDMLEESKGLLLQRRRTMEDQDSEAGSSEDGEDDQSGSEGDSDRNSDEDLTQDQLEAKYRRILGTLADDDSPVQSADEEDHEPGSDDDEEEATEDPALSDRMDVDASEISIPVTPLEDQTTSGGDATLTQEQLRLKYQSLMEKSMDEIYDEVGYDDREDVSSSGDGSDTDSDSSSNHGSEDGSSDDHDDSEEEAEDDEDAPTDMLGFYASKADLQPDIDANKMIDHDLESNRPPSPVSLEEREAPDADLNDADDDDKVTSTESLNPTPTEEHAEEMEVVDRVASPRRDTPESMDVQQRRSPLLLRGDLRAYQHDGLDWLSSLWANGTNGILADEMGLGKTIQTIALLAHIAERGHWGPHLVVVPTSVMLNWEMEFKKWCPGFKILTYYGSQDERKNKRRGWYNQYLHTVGNVVITSYQLILQDEAAFKKRDWYYLVLDEAHNIKNFQSQRWQALLRFKTQRRLLLTGTPLQNNIQELWSLLYFLMPSGDDGQGGFAGLENFTQALKRPANQILEQGKSELDAAAQKAVTQLHTVLRPYLLRRLKKDVEKQMPEKYEHVVYCRLSKRQRQLYDGFMGRADTRKTLSSGNYMSIMNCLMSLRKVCNHPDLFETRQIVTSFAMPKSVAADFEIKDLLFRKHLMKGVDEASVNLDHLNLRPIKYESQSTYHIRRAHQLKPDHILQDLVAIQTKRLTQPAILNGSVQSGLSHVIADLDKTCLQTMHNAHDLSRQRSALLTGPRGTQYLGYPIYGASLHRKLYLDLPNRIAPPVPKRRQNASDWYMNTSSALQELVPTLDTRSYGCENLVRKFGCVTPNVVVQDLNDLVMPRDDAVVLRRNVTADRDPYHEARIRLSIAFPDKRLLQYDCGKLQRLDSLLRTLIAGGHRALIFTQMTKVLDILEEFLNMHNYRYLRLDGSTPIEKRQIYTNQFNQDTRIPVFILSSRSGGLGLNLTGADTVIFYDLDWNPAMDKQCQDRAHRIGQTRDVHIYRFVSEYTIETNILRKSNQKRLLDDVIIQKGDFTTDYFNKITYKDALDAAQDLGEQDNDASAAMDRVLGGMTGEGKALEQVEDAEDVKALEVARKEQVEEIQEDEADFNEEATKETLEQKKEKQEQPNRHVDDFMVEHLDWELRDEPLTAPRKDNKKGKRGVPGARKRIR